MGPRLLKTKVPKKPRKLKELNTQYKSSQVSGMMGINALRSSEVLPQNMAQPYSTMLEGRAMHWYSPTQGAEGLFRKSTFALNQTNAKIDSLDVELRWHRRWIIQLDDEREIQWTFFAGAELFHGVDSTVFTNSYQLMKFGSSVDYPVGRRWEMGGEVAFGTGSSGTFKYEISGRFSYYLNHKYSIGGSYRLDLLEDGSPSLVLHSTPYREGYSEMAAHFTYHY
jgi:hypothetical protein